MEIIKKFGRILRRVIGREKKRDNWKLRSDIFYIKCYDELEKFYRLRVAWKHKPKLETIQEEDEDDGEEFWIVYNVMSDERLI